MEDLKIDVEVPNFFACPISLQIMRDPVALPTGITYDRESIERWIFTDNHNTCPITNQHVAAAADCDLITPNHTLRRLIQSWCSANASQGVERFPTPRPPVTKSQISDLIQQSSLSRDSLLSSLKKIKTIVAESERNKRCVADSPGAIEFLVSVVKSSDQEEDVVDEALTVLYSLQLKEKAVMHLPDFMETLTAILRRSSYQSRAYAVLLLKSLICGRPPSSSQLITFREELFVEVVKVLRDRISYKATKAALQLMATISFHGRNRVKVVEAGAVPVLIELLLEETEKRACEMMLVVLSRLCECAEGRAQVVGHAAGIAILSKKMVRVSVTASERTVSILHSIAKFLPATAVLKEMLEVGVVSKLCLLVQVDIGSKTKERVKEMLSLHARVWRNSPCISPQLQSYYPSP